MLRGFIQTPTELFLALPTPPDTKRSHAGFQKARNITNHVTGGRRELMARGVVLNELILPLLALLCRGPASVMSWSFFSSCRGPTLVLPWPYSCPPLTLLT